MGRRRHLPVDADPRVTMAAFDRAMLSGDAEAERALSAIASVPYPDDEDDEPPERVMTAARLAELEAQADARAEARGGWDVVYDEAAAAALAPLPDIDLSDAACMDIAALLGPYVSEDQ